jgi:hypothetical protein
MFVFSLGVGDSITRLLMSVETETSCCCFYHLPLSHREQCFCFPSALNGMAQKTTVVGDLMILLWQDPDEA